MIVRVERIDVARFASFVLFALVFSNLLVLDIWIIRNTKEAPAEIATVVRETVPPPQQETCGDECVSNIYDAIKEATASVQLSASVQTESESESIVILGAGVNTTDEWADVVGASSYIDSTKYGSIKKVTFEATVQIPNGNQTAWVRLYNATDKRSVWLSEMSHEGGEPKLLIPQPITLDSGNKLYQVQMKSQLKDKTNLLQSRVRITSYK